MARYSRVVKREGRRFRYNFTDCVIEWIYKENGIDEIIDSIGLSKEHWLDKEVREGYLEEYNYRLDCEARELMWEYERFERSAK